MAGNVSGDSSDSVGELFDVLARPERRYALYYLRDRGTATVGELATVLAGWQGSRSDQYEIVTPSDRERLLVSLHHRDLPKLRDAGVVRYDPASGEVALDATDDAFDAVVSEILDHERRATERRGDESRDGENAATTDEDDETPDERGGDER